MLYVFRHPTADDALRTPIPYVFRHPTADDALRTPIPYVSRRDATISECVVPPLSTR
jgi:hypothetical protein